jgi:hypothetical protein
MTDKRDTASRRRTIERNMAQGAAHVVASAALAHARYVAELERERRPAFAECLDGLRVVTVGTGVSIVMEPADGWAWTCVRIDVVDHGRDDWRYDSNSAWGGDAPRVKSLGLLREQVEDQLRTECWRAHRDANTR